MGFTYIGTWCFLPTHIWGHIYEDMGFFPPETWGHGILPSHIDGEHDAVVDSTGKL
jgi:hypothetical protein